MVIWYWTLPSATRPSHDLNEDPVLYTNEFVNGACAEVAGFAPQTRLLMVSRPGLGLGTVIVGHWGTAIGCSIGHFTFCRGAIPTNVDRLLGFPTGDLLLLGVACVPV